MSTSSGNNAGAMSGVGQINSLSDGPGALAITSQRQDPPHNLRGDPSGTSGQASGGGDGEAVSTSPFHSVVATSTNPPAASRTGEGWGDRTFLHKKQFEKNSPFLTRTRQQNSHNGSILSNKGFQSAYICHMQLLSRLLSLWFCLWRPPGPRIGKKSDFGPLGPHF